MNVNNRYGSLASWVYHLDKPIGRSFGDIEYYRERLSGCAGAVLEPAVGNGRVMIPLLQAGLDIHGFDTSPEMLDYCRSECDVRGLANSLSLQDFESFAYDRRFSAIMIPAGSFQLIHDPAVARTVLRRFREALLPGGRLMLDLDPMSSLALPAPGARHWQRDADLLTLTTSPVQTDFVRQTTVAQLRYDHWRNGRLVASQLELFSLRFWGVLEFELALGEAGFTGITASMDYRHGVAPDHHARCVTFEAQAP